MQTPGITRPARPFRCNAFAWDTQTSSRLSMFLLESNLGRTNNHSHGKTVVIINFAHEFCHNFMCTSVPVCFPVTQLLSSIICPFCTMLHWTYNTEQITISVLQEIYFCTVLENYESISFWNFKLLVISCNSIPSILEFWLHSETDKAHNLQMTQCSDQTPTHRAAHVYSNSINPRFLTK
jgi:hypothetical protein